jgi:hypothetical protein
MIKYSITRAVMLVAGLGAVLAVSVPASASQARVDNKRVDNKTVRLGSCRSSGGFATCEASGSANDPIRIKVHVDASPNQRFTGDWSMVCSKGTGAGTTSGTVSGLTPRVKELRMPFTNPDSCDVAAIASLNGSGSIFVYLTARVP